MLASLGAALAGKLGVVIGGIITIAVAYFGGRIHGAASAKNAQATAQSQAENADLHEEQSVTQDMTSAQINGPRTLEDVRKRAEDKTL